jgi:hypothetical protein
MTGGKPNRDRSWTYRLTAVTVGGREVRIRDFAISD